MQTQLEKTHPRGYGTILMVLFVGILSLLLFHQSYKVSLRSLASQRKVQLQLDYNQKEQAFLTTLVGMTPKFLANNMIDGSLTSNATTNRQTTLWNLSRQSEAVSRLNGNYNAQLPGLNLNAHTSANTGTTRFGRPWDYIGILPATAATPAGWRGHTSLGRSYPPRLALRGSANSSLPALNLDHSTRDHLRNANNRLYLSPSYTYASSGGGSLHPNLYADPQLYSHYNLIPYPNISFGYGAPGQPFVARLNWWRLFMHSESNDSVNTGIAVNQGTHGNHRLNFLDREYILSVYEIPSQLAINANTFVNLGSFDDGTAWTNAINIQGGVYAKSAATAGTLNIERLATQQGAAFGGNTTIGKTGATIDPTTGVNKNRFEATQMDFYPVAKSSDSSKSLFVGLQQGDAFFDRFAATYEASPIGERASYQNFYQYSRGCHQTAMKLDIIEQAGSTPIALQFTYIDNTGVEVSIRLDNTSAGVKFWPLVATEPGYDTFPFIRKALTSGEVAIEVHVDRIADYLTGITGSAGIDVNHSITVNPDYISGTGVTQPTNPLTAAFPVVVLDGTEDLTSFTSGFSYVSNLRTYIKTDLNITTAPIPTGSGLTEFYPPVSIFAPEIRYGLGTNARINIQGRIGSLSSNIAGIDILDLKRGDGNVDPATITASLEAIQHPSQIPPVNIMNWLVVLNRVTN